MAKNLNITLLYDIYGDMLTEKQQEVLELYYNEDLSLAEIAEHTGITRQGVRDSIKRGEHQLSIFEDTLGLAKRLEIIEESLDEIGTLVTKLDKVNGQGYRPIEVKQISQNIGLCLDKIKQSQL